MGFNRLKDNYEDEEDEAEVEDTNKAHPVLQFPELVLDASASKRWEKATIMFMRENPDISISQAKVAYRTRKDGSIDVYINGTTLKINIKETEWNWLE